MQEDYEKNLDEFNKMHDEYKKEHPDAGKDEMYRDPSALVNYPGCLNLQISIGLMKYNNKYEGIIKVRFCYIILAGRCCIS